jgi:hypothetical protein
MTEEDLNKAMGASGVGISLKNPPSTTNTPIYEAVTTVPVGIAETSGIEVISSSGAGTVFKPTSDSQYTGVIDIKPISDYMANRNQKIVEELENSVLNTGDPEERAKYRESVNWTDTTPDQDTGINPLSYLLGPAGLYLTDLFNVGGTPQSEDYLGYDLSKLTAPATLGATGAVITGATGGLEGAGLDLGSVLGIDVEKALLYGGLFIAGIAVIYLLLRGKK